MLTNAGRDYAASAMLDNTGSRAAVAGYMAITANSGAPSATDTTLTGEIATASGGLIRKAYSGYAHTGGTATAVVSATFTANGNDTVPVVVAKMGIFNASSSGTLIWETLLPSTATITASGDAVTVTDTVTFS